VEVLVAAGLSPEYFAAVIALSSKGGSSTHPPPQDRLDAILDYYRTLVRFAA
jgi:hypothetical protein